LRDGRLVAPDGSPVGTIADGVICFPVGRLDRSIEFYRDVGGAHFHERATVAYAMSSLDTAVYHDYLSELRPPDRSSVVIDVGGGDGRNALPWLHWGYERVVVVDAVQAALARFRSRVAADHPEWLGRLLLVEADARHLPFCEGCAGAVQTIETLAYLNEEYETGLRECVRLMAPSARLLVSDRDYEGGLLTQLFYGGGVRGLLDQVGRRDIVDGNGERAVRSRCFTADELAAMVRACGLKILSQKGISALSLVLGHERAAGRLAPADDALVGQVHDVLRALGKEGCMLRSHVIIAGRA
jgi:SAM-dependent methyltransferase